MTESTAAHFPHGDIRRVHAGDRTDESGVAHIHPRQAAFGFHDDYHGVILQAVEVATEKGWL